MSNFIFKPDTTYNLECIHERFEVPADSVPNDKDTKDQRAFKLIFIEQCAKRAGDQAIEKYTRLRKWRFRDDLPVELDESILQLDLDDWEFSNPNAISPIAKDRGQLFTKKGKFAYVLKMWFETPEIHAVVYKSTPDMDHEDEIGHAEGFALQSEVNEHYKTKEEKKVQGNG